MDQYLFFLRVTITRKVYGNIPSRLVKYAPGQYAPVARSKPLKVMIFVEGADTYLKKIYEQVLLILLGS